MSHSAKFASACEFHLDEYLDEVAKEDDDRRELCDGEQRNDEIRHEKCLVFLVATNMLIKLAVGKDGNERVPAWHAELGIHLPLTDKSHERDGEQQDQRKEKRTRQGRIGVHQIFLSDIIAARQFIHTASLEKRRHQRISSCSFPRSSRSNYFIAIWIRFENTYVI